MSAYILSGAVILTVDKDRRIIENGAVYVNNERITDVGSNNSILQKYPDAEVIDLSNHILMPGLIDTHGHAGHALMYTLVKDTIYWMDVHNDLYNNLLSDDFWHIESRLAALQRATFGVTTGVSVMGSQSMCYRESYVREQVEGYKKVGIRDILSCGPGDLPWPKSLCHVENGHQIHYSESYDEAINSLENIVSKYNNTNDTLTKIFITPYKIVTSLTSETESEECDSLTDMDLRNSYEMRRIAKKYHTRIHTDAFKGMVHLAYKDPNALLGPDVHIQHGQGLSMDEVEIMAKTKTNFSFWPTIAHFKSKAPIIELMSRGVNVAISTDGPSYSSNFDMLSAMRKAQFLVRALYNERNYLPNEKILEMGTIDAARCIGMQDEIGSIEPGKRADLISIDINKVYFKPYHDPVNLVIRCASGNDVDNVICNGKFVIRNNRFLNGDANEIFASAQRKSEEIVQRLGIQGFSKPKESQWGKYKAYYPEKRYKGDKISD